MNPITEALLLKSLDGLALRASATAHNIANASTPGYRPMRVSFETELANAAADGLAAVKGVRPTVAPDAAFQPGDSFRLDLEMASASMTASRYGALVELLNRHLQITAAAVSGGR
ncbi:hypothetical protein [Brevundimonas sp.]|jgi:flagellar basal-body rod protein FlgB|uniref:flagellar basal body rod protein FlgB n=1 Tax=Brevundimonas sp. TaxID=1871086 RepID=UPI002E12801C|nr:hypothetical protein [Brevundimonas sp.]